MTTECMIDLETFGMPPDGLIVSIGAVKFDPDTVKIVDRFHLAIDPELCRDQHFTIDPGTVKWWLDPKRDAPRQVWLDQPKFDPGTALAGFLDWYGPATMPTWGNAVTFDIILMKSAFKALHLGCPWQFWDERCHRTLKTIPPEIVTKRSFQMGIMHAGSGVLHTALFDAEVQAWQNMLIRGAMQPKLKAEVEAEPDALAGYPEHEPEPDALAGYPEHDGE